MSPVFVGLILFVAVNLGEELPDDGTSTTPAPFTVCEYKGGYYTLGQQWQDGPCDSCYCMSTAANVSICRKSCPVFTFVPASCHVSTPVGKCCPEVSCDASSKCIYKGGYHNLNETWNDACTAVCTCLPGRLVSCRARCPTFTQIPAGCKLVPPAVGSGECCSSIHCEGSPVG